MSKTFKLCQSCEISHILVTLQISKLTSPSIFTFRLSNARFDERDGANDSGSDDDNTDASDSDSESDEPEISIRPIDASQFKPIPDEERSTHFVAIKITDPEIVENAIKIQQHIADQEEVTPC